MQQLLCSLPADFSGAVLIAQHMPARFTKAFAQRLNRLVPLTVVEAADGHRLCGGVVYIAPGSGNIEIEVVSENGTPQPVVRVVPPGRDAGMPVITPSADHLFKSLATLYGARLCILVLTGMGSDGREGARVAKAAGARVLAEDPKSAVMPGMPYAVVEANLADAVLTIEEIPAAVVEFCES